MKHNTINKYHYQYYKINISHTSKRFTNAKQPQNTVHMTVQISCLYAKRLVSSPCNVNIRVYVYLKLGNTHSIMYPIDSANWHWLVVTTNLHALTAGAECNLRRL